MACAKNKHNNTYMVLNDDEPPSPTPTLEHVSDASSESTLEYGSDLEARLDLKAETSIGTKRKITSVEGPPPTNKGLRKLYDKFSSMSNKKRAKIGQLFKSMHFEREKNRQNVVKLSNLMSQFSSSHPEEFARYQSELRAIEWESSYRRGRPMSEDEEAEVSVDWNSHIQETRMRVATRLSETATEQYKTWVDLRSSTDCPHTRDEQEIRDLIEESIHARKAAMGELELDDERRVVEADYPHSICEGRVARAAALEHELRTTEQLALDCDEIRDISKQVLSSALGLCIAENNEPWFRFNFLHYKD